MNLTQWDRHELITQYEALRREATAPAAALPRGHGLALFVVQGMHAWLAALTALAPPPRSVPRDRCDPPAGARGPLTAGARAELTTVLAGMVLAVCAEGGGGW